MHFRSFARLHGHRAAQGNFDAGILVDMQDGDIDRFVRKGFVYKGHFRGMRAIGVHHHAFLRAVCQEIAIRRDQREHHVGAFCQRLNGILRDGFARFIHVVHCHLGGFDHPLIGEGELRGGSPFQRHGQGIGGGAGQYVIRR